MMKKHLLRVLPGCKLNSRTPVAETTPNNYTLELVHHWISSDGRLRYNKRYDGRWKISPCAIATTSEDYHIFRTQVG